MAGQIQGSAWPSLHPRHTRVGRTSAHSDGGLSTYRQVIPGTLATEFRDFGDRNSGQLGVILGTLATKLIGDTNNFPISLGR